MVALRRPRHDGARRAARGARRRRDALGARRAGRRGGARPRARRGGRRATVPSSSARSSRARTASRRRRRSRSTSGSVTARCADLRLGLLHGQLQVPEKESVMDRFRSGTIDVLVATTVIEVGVDVPDATVMVIEDAYRFGIAQLHQLRGRVGRSTLASWCYLLGEPTTADGAARLEAVAGSNDGFALAETRPRAARRGDDPRRAPAGPQRPATREALAGPRRARGGARRSPRRSSTRTPSSPGTKSCARSSRCSSTTTRRPGCSRAEPSLADRGDARRRSPTRRRAHSDPGPDGRRARGPRGSSQCGALGTLRRCASSPARLGGDG